MLDIRTKLVLSILAKECGGGNYKVIEISDIIMQLPRHLRIDSDAVKRVLMHLERQDIISIKYEDEDVFCLAVLPYGYEILETEKPKRIKSVSNGKSLNFPTILLTFLGAFLGATIGVLICFFIFKS